jgi:hypothetical protein
VIPHKIWTFQFSTVHFIFVLNMSVALTSYVRLAYLQWGVNWLLLSNLQAA